MSITRRLFLRNTAAAGAVAATIVSPTVVEAAKEPEAVACWEAFIASLGNRVPPNSRIQIFGSATAVRAEIIVTQIEQVHPKVTMPVDRSFASYRLTANGWKAEAYR